MDTLDVLYDVRARLANPEMEFRFTSWMHCLCGHVYAAANYGAVGSTAQVVRGEGVPPTVLARYRAALGAIAPKVVPILDPYSLASQVSTMTAVRTNRLAEEGVPYQNRYRMAAMQLIDEAIARLEEHVVVEEDAAQPVAV